MRSTRRTINSHRRAGLRAFMTAVVAALAIAPTLGGGGVANAAAGAPLGGVFGGYTSKNWPVVIEVSRNGKRVKRAVAGIESPCTSGGVMGQPDVWKDLPIRGRRFKDAFTNTQTEGGLLYEFSGSIQGQLNRKRTRISGTWSAKMVARNLAGATLDTCDSGAIAFTARR